MIFIGGSESLPPRTHYIMAHWRTFPKNRQTTLISSQNYAQNKNFLKIERENFFFQSNKRRNHRMTINTKPLFGLIKNFNEKIPNVISQ